MYGCGEQEAGVASGSGWNLRVWLLGVVVRRYIDQTCQLIPWTYLPNSLDIWYFPWTLNFEKKERNSHNTYYKSHRLVPSIHLRKMGYLI